MTTKPANSDLAEVVRARAERFAMDPAQGAVSLSRRATSPVDIQFTPRIRTPSGRNNHRFWFNPSRLVLAVSENST